MANKHFRLLPLIALVCAFTGCSHRFYSLDLKNDTTGKITDAKLQYGSRLLDYSTVNGTRGYGTVYLPIPETASASWVNGSGKKIQSTTEIRKLVPKPNRFDGWITIHLGNDGITFVEVRTK